MKAPSEVWKQLERHITKDNATGCWNWTGALSPTGYGKVRVEGVTRQAHRVAYENAAGKIGAGKYVLHTCDNRRCINPAHLRQGTQQQNIAEACERNRIRKGAQNGMARLTEETIRRIRANAANGMSSRAQAAIENISHGHIRDIVSRRRWRHL